MRWISICLMLIFSGLPLATQDQATVQRMTTAFEGWMQTNAASEGALAIWYQGKPVATHALGMDAETPMEMASLSKVVTAICVSELVQDGELAYSDSFKDVIGRGPDVTLAQLVNHKSGLFPDQTQGVMSLWALSGKTDKSWAVLDIVMARDQPTHNKGQFQYNNENYALVGLMIEAASGEDYETACQKRVFLPADVMAHSSPQAGAFLPWGGWQMSVDEYAKFLNHWFGSDSDMGKAPLSYPNIALGGGAYYGFGMFFRSFRDDFNFWHHGALCFPKGQSNGSYAVSLMGEWSAVTAYNICSTIDGMAGLDAALSGAVFQ